MSDTDHTTETSPTSEDDLSVEEASRRARSSFLWLASSTLLWQVIAWVLTLATARVLAPGDYGVMAMIEAFIPYLLMVTDFQLGNWIVQEERFGVREREAAQTLVLLFGGAMTVFCAASAPLVSWFFDTPELTPALFALSAIYLFFALRVIPEAQLRRELRFKQIAVMNLVVSLSQGIIQLVLAYQGYGFWSLVIGKIYRELLQMIWFLVLVGIPRRLRWDSSLSRRAINYGLPATGATVAWIVFSTMDNVVVGRMFGTELLGAYAMAFFLVDLPMSKLNTVMRPILVSYFSRLKQHREEAYRVLGKLNRLVGMLIFPILLGMAVTANEATDVILGNRWGAMAEPLQVLCLAAVLRSLTSNMVALFKAFGVPQKELLVNIFTVLTLVPAFVLLGYFLGLPGIYASWLLVYPLSVVYSLKLLREVSGITPRDYLLQFKSPFVCSVLMAAGTALFGSLMQDQLTPLSLLAAKSGIGALLYLLCYRLIYPAEAREVWQLAKSIRGGTSV